MLPTLCLLCTYSSVVRRFFLEGYRDGLRALSPALGRPLLDRCQRLLRKPTSSLLVRRSGQPHNKRTAFSKYRFDSNCAAKKGRNDIPHNRQSETRPCPKRFGRKELVKNTVQIFCWDTASLITDVDFLPLIRFLYSHLDHAFFCALLLIGINGIANQIGQHLTELTRIPVQYDI